MESKINIDGLDSNIKQKIPLTIRLKYKNKLVSIDDLPIDVASLLTQYQENISGDLSYNDVFDLLPKLSIYNDFYTINDVKTVIIEYFQASMATSVGSYPFDPSRGTRLKSYLGSKDIEDTRHLIQEEINNIALVISESVGKNVKIKNTNINKSNNLNSVSYFITLDVVIDDLSPVILQFDTNNLVI